jgi:pimeloyl-ACP methyl ester carboxylesterase
MVVVSLALPRAMPHSGPSGAAVSRSLVRERRLVRGSVWISYDLVTLTRPGAGSANNPITFVLTPGGQTGVAAMAGLKARLEAAVLSQWRADGAGHDDDTAPARRFDAVHLLSWDRRNTGASSFGYSDSAVPVLADEAADLLALVTEELALPNVHLYGFSSGARVSLRLAADRPDVVVGVVACPPTGGQQAAKTVASMYYSQ